MAEWKLPMSYNYSPSYHAYAYGFLRPPGSEQSPPNVEWPEVAFNHSGNAGGNYAAPQPEDQNEARSPNSGIADAQGGQLFFSHNLTDPSEDVSKDDGRPCSETSHESDGRTPGSNCTASDVNGCATQAAIAPWGEKVYNKLEAGSPDSSGLVSSPLRTEGKPPAAETEDERTLPPVLFSPAPASQGPPKKGKARTAFSEYQMNALSHRFSVQRYLTPVEMKTLAEFTGLTYKQVKTWFQNRRMKLKRHQKDSNWSTYTSMSQHPQFQRDQQQLMQNHYSAPQFMFSKDRQQMLAFYTGYPPHAVTPQPPGETPGTWNLPQPSTYDHSSSGYGGSGDEGAAVNATGSPEATVLQNAPQWAT